MALSVRPIFFKTAEIRDENDNPIFINNLKYDIQDSIGRDADILLDFPVIYMHIWQNADDERNNRFSIYVGESENVIQRTTEHYRNAKIPQESRTKDSDWQFHMIEDVDSKGKKVIPTMYIIGHKYFHKSLTLALENKLIDYCDAMVETAHPYNGRGNPQGDYSGKEYFDDIFSMIWSHLHHEMPKLFLPESKIKKSAIFKSSPNHKLTEDQENAKAEILNKVVSAVIDPDFKTNQLIFVEGEAGTGKTVLTSSTFYDLIYLKAIKDRQISCRLLINHDEQFANYQTMARQLGIDINWVMNPTSFISQHSIKNQNTGNYEVNPNNIVDVVFIDEAHLLWTQPKQAFKKAYGKNQLDEIMKRARITVMMFDEYQVLRKEQYCEPSIIDSLRALSQSQNNYIKLVNQLRMNCDQNTMDWIDNITKNLEITSLNLEGNKDTKNYEVRLFDNPLKLERAIRTKANNKDSELSRLIATYDWEYKNEEKPNLPQIYWNVCIDYDDNGNSINWTRPWNEQHYHIDIEPGLNRRQKTKMKLLDWAEKDYSLDEVGSTFTIQGFDLDYAGVIIGPSVRYDDTSNKIWFDESKRGWDQMVGNRTLEDGSMINVTNVLSQHELRVLLTRGTKGLYIYACDSKLRGALKKSMK